MCLALLTASLSPMDTVYDTVLIIKPLILMMLCMTLCAQDLLASMNEGSHVPGAATGIPVPNRVLGRVHLHETLVGTTNGNVSCDHTYSTYSRVQYCNCSISYGLQSAVFTRNSCGHFVVPESTCMFGLAHTEGAHLSLLPPACLCRCRVA